MGGRGVAEVGAVFIALAGDGDPLFGRHDVDTRGADGEDGGFDTMGGHEVFAHGEGPCWFFPTAGIGLDLDHWESLA